MEHFIKNNIEDNYFSKKRKTAHTTQNNIIKNPLKVFDLNTDMDNINQELDSKTPLVDFTKTSQKKRKFNKIDEDPKLFISNIPNPGRVNIYYSKYMEHPSNLPKI